MIAVQRFQKASPAALRARELAEIHKATCRARRQRLVCSLCIETEALAVRLEART
jgi:hypothetical protein